MSPTQTFILQLVDKLGDKVTSWPVITLIVVLVVTWLARDQVPGLVARITSIGKEGVRISPPSQQIGATSAPEGINGGSTSVDRELSSLTDLDLVEFRATGIYASLEVASLRAEEREATLVKLLAGALLRESWERTYNFIYGSQLRLLQRLNENPPSLPEQQVRAMYDATAKQYPQIFRVYPFEGWIGFLEAFGLIMRFDDAFALTPIGRGFLRYLVRLRYSFNRLG